ncbi:MAG TPA: tetratricopeptide repeat protein, partial [Bacteroidales bacterium]|nr:tetratricopeptide repeat protein [Bacteroidales bacterium]
LNGDGNHPGFLEIIDNFGGTPSGNLAHYYVGMIYLKQGLFEDAIEELEKFDGDDDIIGPMATGCIGDAYMELGNQEEALNYYLEASEQSENSFTSPMYLMRAAWVYEGLGDWDKAIELYEKIRNDYKKSFEGSEINKYIARATAMKNSAQ